MFATVCSHAAAHVVMLPLHYLPVNSGGGVHWYARVWQNFYEVSRWLLS